MKEILKYLSGMIVVYVICVSSDRNATCKVLFSLLPPHTAMYCAISSLEYPLFPSARRKCAIYYLQAGKWPESTYTCQTLSRKMRETN